MEAARRRTQLPIGALAARRAIGQYVPVLHARLLRPLIFVGLALAGCIAFAACSSSKHVGSPVPTTVLTAATSTTVRPSTTTGTSTTTVAPATTTTAAPTTATTRSPAAVPQHSSPGATSATTIAETPRQKYLREHPQPVLTPLSTPPSGRQLCCAVGTGGVIVRHGDCVACSG
jgi:hypothetical protein